MPPPRPPTQPQLSQQRLRQMENRLSMDKQQQQQQHKLVIVLGVIPLRGQKERRENPGILRGQTEHFRRARYPTGKSASIAKQLGNKVIHRRQRRIGTGRSHRRRQRQRQRHGDRTRVVMVLRRMPAYICDSYRLRKAVGWQWEKGCMIGVFSGSRLGWMDTRPLGRYIPPLLGNISSFTTFHHDSSRVTQGDSRSWEQGCSKEA